MGVYGWADGHREGDAWAQAYAEQTELLDAQLSALRAGLAGRRRAFRALEYACNRCGDVLLEVMKTSPYWTLCTWSSQSVVSPAVRRGKVIFRPLPDPLPDPQAVSHVPVHTACRCQSPTLNEGMVVADLKNGIKKRALPASGRDA